MRLSIALCTYNGARFLNDQLRSIADQSRLPDEVVVFDDCSTDQTVEILRAFAAGVEFPVDVRVNDRRLGSTRNFEQAILSCTGDVILLADQDDVWRRQKLHKLEEAFRTCPEAGVMFSNALIVDEHGRSLGFTAWECTMFGRSEQELFRRGRPYRLLVQRNPIVGATMAFRSQFRNLALPIPDSIASTSGFAHDWWVALAISAVAGIAFLDDILVDYRRHAGQQLGVNLPGEPVRGRSTNGLGGGLSAVGVLYGTRAERKKFLARLLDRLALVQGLLLERGGAFGVMQTVSEIEGWKRHLRTRLSLLEEGRGRSGAVLGEFLRRGYHRYANGLGSALGDLLSS